jgi:hypothetical protein
MAEVDVEGLISRFLRDDTAIDTATGGRVYTDLPHEREYPMVLIQRSGGPPVSGFSLSHADCTVSVYGGRHVEAQQLIALVLATLDGLPGQHDGGCVASVAANSITYTPDPESPDPAGHARPRYVSEITVVCHP